MKTQAGILILDKPPALTSARAVARVKRLLPRGIKIGHAGTLDPFATGVLLLLVGSATRQCESLMDSPKKYDAAIKLGASTESGDPEFPEIPATTGVEPTIAQINDVLPRFVGAIQQRPPKFSAVKISGSRAYALARKGVEVEMPPRTVQIYSIELISYSWPMLNIRVGCGRGTYIRSLAADLGIALGTAGYLTALRRTAIGEFDVKNAVTLEQLAADGVEKHLISADDSPAHQTK